MTPLTVGTVVGLVAAGRTRDEILREYPYLEAEDIAEALTTTAWNDLVTRWITDPAVTGSVTGRRPGASGGTRLLIKPTRRRPGARYSRSSPVSWVKTADQVLAGVAPGI